MQGKGITLPGYTGKVDNDSLAKYGKPLVDSGILKGEQDIDVDKLKEQIDERIAMGVTDEEEAELEGLKSVLTDYSITKDNSTLLDSTVTVTHGIETLFSLDHTDESNVTIVSIASVMNKPELSNGGITSQSNEKFRMHPSGYLHSELKSEPLIYNGKVVELIETKPLEYKEFHGAVAIGTEPQTADYKSKLTYPELIVKQPVDNYSIREFSGGFISTPQSYMSGENIPTTKLEKVNDDKSKYQINIRFEAYDKDYLD